MTTRLFRFATPVPYDAALRLMDDLVRQRLEDRIPDTVLLLEHEPVITLGIRARREHLLLSPDALARRGIALHETPRGGDVTYHGPGQLVLYPILKLAGAEADAHAFVNRLEDIAIRTAAAFGVTAERRKGKTGAWTARGKLAAIGVRFRHWVSSHGMSFNVSTGPDDGFDAIVPCGLHGETVTSLRLLLGDGAPSLDAAGTELLRQFEQVMRRPLTAVAAPSIPGAGSAT